MTTATAGKSKAGVILIAALALALAVSACGKKGDPVRPDTTKEEKADG